MLDHRIFLTDRDVVLENLKNRGVDENAVTQLSYTSSWGGEWRWGGAAAPCPVVRRRDTRVGRR